jgi:hypothetical protein
MAETVKTDPKEHAARKKWQDEVSSQLGADAISSGMFVNQMKDSFDAQTQYWSNSIRMGDMSNNLLQSVEANTFRTADLFAEYLDFIKDAERKRLEAAMEAARLAKDKDKGGGGGGAPSLGGLDFSWGGLAAGLGGAAIAGLALFKDSITAFFTGDQFTKLLDNMKIHRTSFFDKIKGALGFPPGDVKDLGKTKSGMWFNLKKYFGFEQKFPNELAKQKAGFADDIGKFLKFGPDTDKFALAQKNNFTKTLGRLASWATDAEKLTDANKLKFFNAQTNMLKWMNTAEDMSAADKAGFLKKQSKMLAWMADHTDGIQKDKLKFLKSQSKMLAFAADAEGLSDAAKIKFLKKHANILEISDEAADAGKLAKTKFNSSIIKMLGLDPAKVDDLVIKKQGMFSKLKTKIFNIGDDVAEGIVKAKAGFSTRFGAFFKMPMFAEGSKLMQVKTGFLTAIDNIFGTMLKITKGFFKLVNVLNFGALGFLNAEALAHPIKTFNSFRDSFKGAFGPKDGILTKAAKTFSGIIAPLTDWIKPLKDILGFVGKIAKVIGKVFIPIGFLFSAFDVISNIVDGYKEGGITGAIGAGIESVFDDVLFAIPNLLGEAVAWILKKFDFKNAVAFIDKNLRDKDGNFSLFTGIKKLFTMATDAIYDHVLEPVFAFVRRIPQFIARLMMDMGFLGKKAAKGIFGKDSKHYQMAKMEKDDPEAYKRLVAAEERKRKEERELARQERDRQPVNVVDNSVVTTKTEGIVLQTDLDTSSRKDSLKKVVTQ